METVSAFWPARQESRQAVASRLADCFALLAHVDPTLSGWRAKGRSRRSAAANPVLVLDAAVLAEHLTVQRGDFGGDVMEELGFSLSVWNGEVDHRAAAFSCRAGASAAGGYVGNAVTLQVPAAWGERPQLLEGAVTSLRRVWEPTQVVWFGADDTQRVLWAAPGPAGT